MQSLTLGGHNSVSNLLYERDCLAAALAAEKRRSAEFEQMWLRSEEGLRRAEQELQQLQGSAELEQQHAELERAEQQLRQLQQPQQQLWWRTGQDRQQVELQQVELQQQRVNHN